MEKYKPLIDNQLQKQIKNKLQGIDPKVFVQMYLFAHPETTQAQLAKDAFGVSPATFSAALGRSGNKLREDWQEIIVRLAASSYFRDYQQRVNEIYEVSSLIKLQRHRSAVKSWALNYLSHCFCQKPELYIKRIIDNKCLIYLDPKTKRFWVFIIADEEIDTKPDPNSHDKLFRHYGNSFSSDDTLCLVTQDSRHIEAYTVRDDNVQFIADIRNPNRSILLVTDDFTSPSYRYDIMEEDIFN